ncbi:NUDIX hydrolase [Sphingomonas nostoxanthinifaciens]|uniref:NUDIX hydrolase n=1 Tax=Sphingomonas nostoxanthinifaciens TaxID=2872652 RepID=UPI001CC204EB|nr:NUDIX domain-containing protein [Sphingomonas nostoxanthinifaciens]UAK25491.1 NUDIX domain-containing protein [Sphingomonas nostoxanthinifaciens]
MTDKASRTIQIAAALIDDSEGRLLLVRKAGTNCFMQAGGKIEDGESPTGALRRELAEEIGLVLADGDVPYLGCYSAPAANEPDHIVEAEVYHVRAPLDPVVQSEIAEAIWVDVPTALTLPLAPLTRDHILPLFQRL